MARHTDRPGDARFGPALHAPRPMSSGLRRAASWRRGKTTSRRARSTPTYRHQDTCASPAAARSSRLTSGAGSPGARPVWT